MEILGTKHYLNSKSIPIESNYIPLCYHCEIPLTKENNSGWEVFTKESEGTKTQAICKNCDEKQRKLEQNLGYPISNIIDDGSNFIKIEYINLETGVLEIFHLPRNFYLQIENDIKKSGRIIVFKSLM